jgi:hypothetical protein
MGFSNIALISLHALITQDSKNEQRKVLVTISVEVVSNHI